MTADGTHGRRTDDADCRRCYYSQVPAVHDRFFLEAVRPYCWFAAVLLFLSYIIGLWFTLRTHAAVIWNTELEEKKAHFSAAPAGQNGTISHQSLQGLSNPPPKHKNSGSSGGSVGRTAIRDSQLYKRILGQSLKQAGLSQRYADDWRRGSSSGSAPHGNSPRSTFMVPPKSSGGDSTVVPDHASQKSTQIAGLSEEDSNNLVLHVAEIAATAAAVAARDATTAPRKTIANAQTSAHHTRRQSLPHSTALHDDHEEITAGEVAHVESGGHDAPNWSRLKSSVILLGATILYAIIAEILVNTVDVVLESVEIDEKFLGITLFALVPNTTEFLVRLMRQLSKLRINDMMQNAISFAMNGNIALSMEIGSAYALQVCMLQIPALVLFSAIHGQYLEAQDLLDHTFK